MGENYLDELGIFLPVVVVRFALAGVLTTLTWRYFKKACGTDPKWVRAWVAFALALDLLNAAGNAFVLHGYAVRHWGNASNLRNITNPTAYCALADALEGLGTQFCFIRRLYKVKKDSLPIVIGSVLLALMSAGAACNAVRVISHASDFREIHAEATFLIWFLGQFACDITILIPTVLGLRRFRTGFKTTDSLVDQIILWIVCSGFLTVALALLIVIVYLKRPLGTEFMSFTSLLGTTYAVTLVAFLNKRGSWEQSENGEEGLFLPSSVLRNSNTYPVALVDGDNAPWSPMANRHATQ